jgi:hypothetical protein
VAVPRAARSAEGVRLHEGIADPSHRRTLDRRPRMHRTRPRAWIARLCSVRLRGRLFAHAPEHAPGSASLGAQVGWGVGWGLVAGRRCTRTASPCLSPSTCRAMLSSCRSSMATHCAPTRPEYQYHTFCPSRARAFVRACTCACVCSCVRVRVRALCTERAHDYCGVGHKYVRCATRARSSTI